MAIFKVALSALMVFLLVGCTDTGGKLEGWVNDTLDRSTITSGDLSLTVNEGSVVGVLLLLDKPIKEDTALSWTVNGPATKFAATTGTLSFSKGDQSKLLQINTLVDPANDGLQSFILSVSGSSLVFANELNIALNILDLSTPPTLTIADVSISEGQLGGTQVAVFTVTSSRPAEALISFNYATSSGSAIVGTDFSNVSGLGSIPVAGTTTTISVPITGDTLFEGDESFSLSLAGGSGYSTVGSVLSATGTIVNDDDAPTLTVGDVSRTEGASGSANLTFTVTTAASGVDIIVNYVTADGATSGTAATGGTDYTITSGTLTIPAGSTSGNINIPILGDENFESDEVFTLTLSGGSGYSSAGSDLAAVGTITNDDPKVHLWNFASGTLDPANFSFDTRFIDFVSGQAPSLKKVGTYSAAAMAAGTHSGTVVSGGYLTLDSTAANKTSLLDILPSRAANLVLYFRMESNWNNSSNYTSGGVTPNFNGTLASGTATFSSNAKVGSKSADFDGLTRVRVGNSGGLEWTSFTRFAWVNIREPAATDMRIFSQQGAAYWILAVRPDLTLKASDSVSAAFDLPAAGSRPALTAGRWHQVAIVRDVGNLQYRFYVDGELRATTANASTAAITPGANDAYIGAYSAGSAYFKGFIDEAAAWNVALTNEEMRTIYNAQKNRFSGTYTSPLVDMGASAPWPSLAPVTAIPSLKPLASSDESVADYPEVAANLMSDILAVWHFDETSGSSFADSTSSGLTGTASGAPTLGEEAMFRTGARLSRASSQCISTASVNLGNTFSFSGWANVGNSTTTAHTLVSNTTQAAASSGFKFFINTWGTGDGAISFQTGNGVVELTAKTPTGLGSVGSWHHYVVTVNKTMGTATIYIDGKLANSGVQAIRDDFSTEGALSLGCMANPTGFLDGTIDEFALWTRVLTEDEVLNLYLRGANRIRYQVRSCAADPCNEVTEPWLGPGQNSTTYFSELYNYSSVVNGSVSGSVRSSPLSLSFDSFTATPPFVSSKRYFQYRIFMESDDDKNLCEVSGVHQACMPKLKSVVVGPADRYYAGSPTLINSNAVTISSALSQMTKSDVTNACTQYQVSTDNGVTWKYYNGSSWVATTGGVAQSNPLSAVEGHLEELGSGSFKFKAFFSTNAGGDFTQSCQLNSVQIKYDGP